MPASINSHGRSCRLGFWKEPSGLRWTPAPPASCHMRVSGVLTAAASSGVACLHLLDMLPVRMVVGLTPNDRHVTLTKPSIKGGPDCN